MKSKIAFTADVSFLKNNKDLFFNQNEYNKKYTTKVYLQQKIVQRNTFPPAKMYAKENVYEKKVYIQEIFTAIKYKSKVYNINVYNKKVLSKNLFNKRVFGLYNKKVYKKDFTKKHVYDNVYHIKLDKTLFSTTCV